MITKLDLMDEGTNALDIFEGKLLPLKKGYVGVINRSQANIDENKSVEESLKKEEVFFKSSLYKYDFPSFPSLFFKLCSPCL